MVRIILFLFIPVLLSAQDPNYVVSYDQFTITDGLSHNHVFQSYKDSRGVLWLISGNGLNRFDGIHFKMIPQVKIADASDTKIFLEDEDGNIWIGGQDQPMLCFNIFTETVMTAREKFGPRFPEQVLSALVGQAGTFILQTSTDSIGRFSPGNKVFELIYHAPGRQIAPVIESNDGTLWLESYHPDKGSELIAINPSWSLMRVIQCPGKIYNRGAWADNSVYYSTSDSFFVAGDQGIFIRKDIRTLFPKSPGTHSPSSRSSQRIAIDQKTGDIWCASLDGLQVFSKSLLPLYSFKGENIVMRSAETYQINIDKQHFVWLSTSDGLFKFRRNFNLFKWQAGINLDERKPPAGLSADIEAYFSSVVGGLRHICLDTDGSWWMATSKGLIHADWLTGEFRTYTVKDGLSDNSCYAVIPDPYGFLWVSSDIGLMQFEKRSGKVKTYYKTDGLDIDKFSPAACFRGKDGSLSFGGVKGVVTFQPWDFVSAFSEQEDVSLVLTECQVFSGVIKQGEDVREDFFKKGKIMMQPDNRFVQMRFALTDYSYPGRVQYEYKIEGYKIEWENMRENTLFLAGLPYGSYQVVVRATSAAGTYAGQELIIPLIVLRPVYQQPSFVLLLVVVLLGSFKGYKKYRAIRSKDAGPGSIAGVEEPPFTPDEEALYLIMPEVALTPADEAFLERIRVIIMEHLDNITFDTKKIGKEVGLSDTQLHRRLKALTGLSTGRFIYSIRLEEAKDRIVNTKLTIAEIAYQTGFSDPAYFTRLFTKRYQHPPGYFREGQ